MKFLFLTIGFVCIFVSIDAKAQECNYWNAAAGEKSSNPKRGNKDEKKAANVLEGIECLLKLEGDKSRGAFSGATSFGGPWPMPQATVEVCALYYISKLFYGKYDHSRAVALRYKNLEISETLNSDDAVAIAYEAYRKWFGKVKEIGLEEARKQKLDPLDGSGVRWY